MKTRDGSTSYIWQYDVKPECIDEFREAYGPKGVWYDYYAQSEHYLGTDLYEDDKVQGRFITIDYFSNGSAREDLISNKSTEFQKIDDQWEHATQEEFFIGQFEVRI